ncbi:ABC transporter ATP-binding protein [Macrococcus armenti]|uniref:ABC transporter ATP-binding protein n=1 Tax=Macrococcus armenti TaxID=2875764 RepID=UPI001CC9439E|nr:ABC transporter ATP-binding protein [Macrococcus armenti]UBH15092.1 ABC transporter ATP-binding protein [Macrococcus armenti]UBH17453.1 ABC transporter ATP-binding protein [Macrococcus armenti]UBH19717.1 ABC transporter ATP-binding protein [Macrococcus armenti]
MESIIRTHQLEKTFKTNKGLKPLDFQLFKGEICAIIGKNGAGKSTFFKLLAGQLQPSGGEVVFFDYAAQESNRARKRMGFMIESPEFFADLTAYENLNYFRLQRGISSKEIVKKVIETVDLAQYPATRFKEYSMGMKQRLGLALTLMTGPDCLVLDEPTNGLDAKGISDIRKLLLKLNKEQNVTILISSHILSELQLVATRFVFIDKGRVIESLSSEELHNRNKKALKLVVDHPARATRVLEESFTDLKYTVLADNTLKLENHVEDAAQINRILMQHDIDVKEIATEINSLEDYFLNLEVSS